MKATVFMDSVSPAVQKMVRTCVEPRFTTTAFVQCEGGLIAAWHMCSHGQQTLAADTFTCFVTESKTLEDADMAYAVYCARIPSLTLQHCEAPSPLMSAPTRSLRDDSERETMVNEFFTFPSKKGKVLVMEGGDGSGKATQTKLLVNHLREEGMPVETMDFPHDAAPYGDLVRMVLSGKKGSISELDPHLFSFIYSLNRYGCLPELRYWVNRGFTVALDRYYTANFGHQASKLPVDKRKAFVHYLERCEVGWLGLPRADQVFYLDLPSQVAFEAMRKDVTRAYLDIHETAGGAYKERVRESYLWCCKELRGWMHVPCCDQSRNRRTREEIHEDIYASTVKVLS